jgi:capsular polysaccharide biosynthesis protein
MASLALALGIGILLEIRDPVLVSADQLELVSELPVLGSVSRI